MRAMLTISFSFSFALVVACGGTGSPGPDSSSSSHDGFTGSPDAATSSTLDCSWLTGPNCYKSTFSPALGCLPDPKARGTLSADGKTCTYATGQVIAFASPIMVPLPSMTPLNFTLTAGGVQCLKVNESGPNTFTITTSVGTFAWAASASDGSLSATCPDGTMYAAPETIAIKAEACASKTTGGPSTSVGGTSTDLSFYLGGTGSGAATYLQIFDCEKT